MREDSSSGKSTIVSFERHLRRFQSPHQSFIVVHHFHYGVVTGIMAQFLYIEIKIIVEGL